jgi:threonine dehydratase
MPAAAAPAKAAAVAALGAEVILHGPDLDAAPTAPASTAWPPAGASPCPSS